MEEGESRNESRGGGWEEAEDRPLLVNADGQDESASQRSLFEDDEDRKPRNFATLDEYFDITPVTSRTRKTAVYKASFHSKNAGKKSMDFAQEFDDDDQDEGGGDVSEAILSASRVLLNDAMITPTRTPLRPFAHITIKREEYLEEQREQRELIWGSLPHQSNRHEVTENRDGMDEEFIINDRVVDDGAFLEVAQVQTVKRERVAEAHPIIKKKRNDLNTQERTLVHDCKETLVSCVSERVIRQNFPINMLKCGNILRGINEHHAFVIQEALGEMDEESLRLVGFEEDGYVIIIDGNHRLTAMMRANDQAVVKASVDRSQIQVPYPEVNVEVYPRAGVDGALAKLKSKVAEKPYTDIDKITHVIRFINRMPNIKGETTNETIFIALEVSFGKGVFNLRHVLVVRQFKEEEIEHLRRASTSTKMSSPKVLAANAAARGRGRDEADALFLSYMSSKEETAKMKCSTITKSFVALKRTPIDALKSRANRFPAFTEEQVVQLSQVVQGTPSAYKAIRNAARGKRSQPRASEIIEAVKRAAQDLTPRVREPFRDLYKRSMFMKKCDSCTDAVRLVEYDLFMVVPEVREHLLDKVRKDIDTVCLIVVGSPPLHEAIAFSGFKDVVHALKCFAVPNTTPPWPMVAPTTDDKIPVVQSNEEGESEAELHCTSLIPVNVIVWRNGVALKQQAFAAWMKEVRFDSVFVGYMLRNAIPEMQQGIHVTGCSDTMMNMVTALIEHTTIVNVEPDYDYGKRLYDSHLQLKLPGELQNPLFPGGGGIGLSIVLLLLLLLL